jgi:hypothetical protein
MLTLDELPEAAIDRLEHYECEAGEEATHAWQRIVDLNAGADIVVCDDCDGVGRVGLSWDRYGMRDYDTCMTCDGDGIVAIKDGRVYNPFEGD